MVSGEGETGSAARAIGTEDSKVVRHGTNNRSLRLRASWCIYPRASRAEFFQQIHLVRRPQDDRHPISVLHPVLHGCRRTAGNGSTLPVGVPWSTSAVDRGIVAEMASDRFRSFLARRFQCPIHDACHRDDFLGGETPVGWCFCKLSNTARAGWGRRGVSGI